MQPVATLTMDLHLEGVMTYTLQIMPVPITAVITPSVLLTEALTVANTSLQELPGSVPVMWRCIMKPFPHKKMNSLVGLSMGR